MGGLKGVSCSLGLGQRVGESHTGLKGQWTGTECVYRRDLDRSYANNDKTKAAETSKPAKAGPWELEPHDSKRI